jgi:SAM-dependent methyltransferase
MKAAYAERFAQINNRVQSVMGGEDLKGKRVLCLGARLGEEVEVFCRMGAWAVGVDVNPGRGNRRVIVADFHFCPFADKSFDLIYTNSLDHALDLAKVASECHRLLRESGRILLEISQSERLTTRWTDSQGRTQVQMGTFESMIWDSPKTVIRAFSGQVLKKSSDSAFLTVLLGVNT